MSVNRTWSQSNQAMSAGHISMPIGRPNSCGFVRTKVELNVLVLVSMRAVQLRKEVQRAMYVMAETGIFQRDFRHMNGPFLSPPYLRDRSSQGP